MCSTPFGITELDTSRASGAQLPQFVCSTPFGITELDTRLLPRPVYFMRVLNAFRHH